MMTTIQYWQRNRHVDQWNKLENPRDFTKRQKINLEKKTSSINSGEKTAYPHAEE